MSYVIISIHRPHPEHRDALIASMHRFGAAMAGRPGLVSVQTLADAGTDRLVGLAIFETEDDFARLIPLARDAVADDPFDLWESEPIEGFRLTDV
jgi:heme-degrading monooxygenase HmoA